MLLRRRANSDEYLEVFADIEVEFTADSGSSSIIPLSKDWNTVGIQVSGGLDSALLLYLTTKAIQQTKLNIEIQPISVFVPTKAKNITSTKAIVNKVRELTGATFIRDGLIFDMPLEESSPHDGKKHRFFSNTIRSLFQEGIINFELNGNTKNPPNEVIKDWKNNKYRQKNRDNALSIYTHRYHASPHYNMDKADIINLYIKYNLLESLAPLTCSCDENIDLVHRLKLNVPCGSCWWCEERRYGFEKNNVNDPAPILSYHDYIEETKKYKN